MIRRLLALLLLIAPLAGAQSYTPNFGIDMTQAGARETFQPSFYFITDSANFAYRTNPANCTTTAGLPAINTIFYEPCFENAASTTSFDAFNVPLKVVNIHNPNASLLDPTNTKIACYPTQARCMTDDAVYGMGDVNGNTTVRNLTTGALTRSSFVCGTSNGASRWLMGPHKYILLCLEGSNIILYKASTDRYCTALSVDGTSDTCNSTTKVTYHASPMPGIWGIGGNEGACQPGANGTAQCPLVKTGSPPDVRLYDVVAKTTVQMVDEPAADLDHCEPSPDAQEMGCQTNGGSWYTWNAITGAILNGGSPTGNVGHAAYGQIVTGANSVLTFNDPSFCTSPNVGVQRKARRPWTSTSFTNLLEHTTGRAVLTSCSDSHWSAFSIGTNPLLIPSSSNVLQHRLVIFDVDGSGNQVSTTGDYTNWREMTEMVVICDYDNPSSDIVNTPNCWKVAHSRRYARDNCQAGTACVQISRDGTKFMLTWDIGTSTNRRVLTVMGDIRAAANAPTLSSVTPNSGTQGTTVTSADLVGTNLDGANHSVTVSGTGVTPQNLANVTATTADIDLVIAADATPGARTLTYETDDGQSNSLTFTVNAAASAPTLSSVACPTTASGWRGAQITCTFTGTGLNAGSEVLNSTCGDVTFPSHVVNGATQITAQVLIAAGLSGETCDFSVTTVNGSSGMQTFTVNSPGPIGSIIPW